MGLLEPEQSTGFFEATGAGDPYRLDGNNDSVTCVAALTMTLGTCVNF